MSSHDLSEGESALVLHAFQQRLNSTDTLPPQALRRNTSEYALVSYINNLTGLLNSGNLQPAAIFITRAATHMQELPPAKGFEPYYDLAYRYLCHVAFHLRQYAAADPAEVEIPPDIALAGPQLSP
jgi:hypothetical protein